MPRRQVKIAHFQHFSNCAVTLVTHLVCPFAARAHIALNVTDTKYKLRETDLMDKPAWFTEIYQQALGADKGSTGKVPVLQDGDNVLTESSHVARYVDAKARAAGRTSLTPADPLVAVESELFGELAGDIIKGWYGLLMGQDAEKQDAARTGLVGTMGKMNEQLLAADARRAKAGEKAGPFIAGESLSFGDVMICPWFVRLAVLKSHRGFEIPSGLARVAEWSAACDAHPAIKSASKEDDYYVDQYKSYANGGMAKIMQQRKEDAEKKAKEEA